MTYSTFFGIVDVPGGMIFFDVFFLMMAAPALILEGKTAQLPVTEGAAHAVGLIEMPVLVGVIDGHPHRPHMAVSAIGGKFPVELRGRFFIFVADITGDTIRNMGMPGPLDLFGGTRTARSGCGPPGRAPDCNDQYENGEKRRRPSQHENPPHRYRNAPTVFSNDSFNIYIPGTFHNRKS